MRLWAALDILDGRVVQLVQGDPDRAPVREDAAPAEVARRWVAEGADGLHIVDLDAAMGRGTNEPAVLQLAGSAGVPVQVAGGVRSTQSIQRRLVAGAQQVVVGTRAIEDPAWLNAKAQQFPGRLVVALDTKQGRVVTHGWRHETGVDVAEAAGTLDALPLAAIVCTTTDGEGKMNGTDRPTLSRLRASTRHGVIASGGISTLDDVEWLARNGFAGCVLGMAIYTRRLDLRKATQRVHEAQA